MNPIRLMVSDISFDEIQLYPIDNQYGYEVDYEICCLYALSYEWRRTELMLDFYGCLDSESGEY